MLFVGEVHTGLLRGRAAAGTGEALRVADLVTGEAVVLSERPIAYVRSPAAPVGVDCALAGAGRTRGVGTVLSRVTLTGGHLLQGSAYATLVPGSGGLRRPWSHYLARPGVIETLGRARWPETAAALAEGGTLDLGGIAGRTLGRAQRALSDRGRSRLPAARTRLRWIAEPTGDALAVRFGLRRDDLRVLRLETAPEVTVEQVAAAGEDVAAHDWLLTTLIDEVGKASIGVLDRDAALRRLLPVIDYLLHLWMPGARGDGLAEQVWAALERRPGFSRQWETLVHRIRDQVSVATVAGLGAAGTR